MALSSNENSNSNSTTNNARQPLIPGYNTSDERKALRNKLRAEAKQARSEMPAPYRAHKSAELCKRLEESLALTLGITGMNAADATIAVYAAFPEEVDLQDFIESAYTQGCKIAFPCMVRDAWNSSEHPNSTGVEQSREREKALKNLPQDETNSSAVQQTMEMRLVSAEQFRAHQVPFLNNPLKRYCHSDCELDPYPYVSARDLTMIVVPVVGFDSRGNRLGYGAGNYDRYLTQISKEATNNQGIICRVVGVAFAEQQVEDVPTEEHDIPLAVVAL